MRWVDSIRAVFERYGFASLETPAVETLEALQAKGETSQEVYSLRRLVEDPKDHTSSRLGLHFDLTVPFARYAAQHFNDLDFPFKRYQIQSVWRGERPQEGRYRQFTQCDIDVINVDNLPLHFDAEVPRIIHEVLTRLDLPDWTINVNNRKVLQGYYEGLGIDDPIGVIRVVDKIDKIGLDGVAQRLSEQLRLSDRQTGACLELAGIRGSDVAVVESVRSLGVRSELLDEGLDELGFVLESLSDVPPGTLIADLSIARGLDYYTGSVYEGKFVDWPHYGSICSGGRYENLAGSFTRQNLPGVGMSIGLTRIFAKMLAEGRIELGPKCPTDVLVVLPSAERRAEVAALAAQLRQRGFNVEAYHEPSRIGKQLRYASRKRIPYVWLPPMEGRTAHEVKAMATGEQKAAQPETWERG